MWKVILLCVFVGITAGKLASYENYKLFRVIPTTFSQKLLIQSLYKFSSTDNCDIWNISNEMDAYLNVMVSPDNVKRFEEVMNSVKMHFFILEDDVQRLINLTTKKGQLSFFDFTNYHTLEKIYKNLDDLTEMYPENVEIIVGGSTYEGRQIKGVKISFKPNNPGVFLEGGINAREWMSPAVVMYIIHQLLSSHDSKIRNMAESYDWYIFPVFNPDGYVYTHTTDRMWTKTLKPYTDINTDINTIGCNPNRNWGYLGSYPSFYSQTNMYGGPKPFSEVETKSMSEYIESIKDKFFAYLSFHSHSSDVTYPPDVITYNTMKLTESDSNMIKIAKTPFIVPHQSIIGNRYLMSLEQNNVVKANEFDRGSTITYIKERYNKSLVLSYGLLDKFSRDGFLQSPERIVWFGEEAVYALQNILKQANLILFNNKY
ncbi:zinc carboxypeptidase-like [Odontomachus brunneus]|uniref:zinc carboxypeptidase-like n=1 Tax=Odontomachus brunneus TaxID=486640 RepID=UPI0013F238FE|nr:zinc carboxypeptidase-like [Odontomachus brunneus]